MNMFGFNPDAKSEMLIAAGTAILIEAVAVTLFFACTFVWLAVYATGSGQ
jgi:hypothetical protein